MNKVEAVSSEEETPDHKDSHVLSEDAMNLISLSKRSNRHLHTKKRKKKDVDEDDSVLSASETLMSSHVMNMGIYVINLGTEKGRTLHMFHLVVLPLIPIFILLIQNISTYIGNIDTINGLQDVSKQVASAVDLATLARKLQEERVAVALNFYMKRRDSLAEVTDLDKYTDATINKEFIKEFKLETAFNDTDAALQAVKYWPKIGSDHFKSKLKFTIAHAVFRTKIREGEKNLEEVLRWYNTVNDEVLDYVIFSIHDSDISDFYRWIIGYKNLLRAVEYSGKAGIFALQYLSNREDDLEKEKYEQFIENDILRKEYLNQTFNFIPNIIKKYDKLTMNNTYEDTQDLIIRKKEFDRSLETTVDYLIQFLRYSGSLRLMIESIARKLSLLVRGDMVKVQNENILPLIMIIVIVILIPICVAFTLNITGAMMRYSVQYDEHVQKYRNERNKANELLNSLLPKGIIKHLKKGIVPKPEMFEKTTIFFCDIVSFTKISSESTAHEIVDFLNDLYNLFDTLIEKHDVYKVETIGDAYMIASGTPIPNGDQHAAEIAQTALNMLAKIIPFKIQHKPDFRLQLRMGMHSGSVVGGLVGTKIPHFSLFGDTVEMAGLMESTGLPMKIQMSQASADLLDLLGGFNFQERGTVNLPRYGDCITYWLIGTDNTPTPPLI